MSWLRRDTTKPRMHCHAELERDLSERDFIDDATLMCWAAEGYSTSSHLLTLYAAARGLPARVIVEIGFGRSSFVLARAAHENGGRLYCCDTDDYRYLLSPAAAAVIDFTHGDAARLYRDCPNGVEMFFLDYLSTTRFSGDDCVAEVDRAVPRLKTNGLIFVHDALVPSYGVGAAMQKLRLRDDLEVAVLPYGYGLGVIRFTGESPHGVIEDTFRKKPDSSG